MTIAPLHRGNILPSRVKKSSPSAEKKSDLENLPDSLLMLIQRCLGIQNQFLSVCRSLNQTLTTHLKKAQICLRESDQLNFPLPEKFTQLFAITIEGGFSKPLSVPSFNGLRELRWYFCPQLDNGDLLQIAQSKNLELFHLTDSRHVSGLGLHYLLGLKKLKDLKIELLHIDDLGFLPRIESSFALKALDIRIGKITTYGSEPCPYRSRDEFNFSALINRIPNLEHFTIKKRLAVHQVFQALKTLHHLESLILLDGVESNKFYEFGKFSRGFSLTKLRISSRVEDRHTEYVCHLLQCLPHIEELNLSATFFTSTKSINCLAQLAPQLRGLKIVVKGRNISDSIFKKLRNLTYLSFAQHDLNIKEALACIEPMQSLKHLKITNGSQNRISAKTLADLASKFPYLKTLKLGEAFGRDEEEVILPNRFEQLESLNVGNIYLSAKAFFGLVTESMPNLNELKLYIFPNNSHLFSLPKLRKLQIKSINPYRTFYSEYPAKGLLPMLESLKEFELKQTPIDWAMHCRMIAQCAPSIEFLKAVTHNFQQVHFFFFEPLQSLKTIELTIRDVDEFGFDKYSDFYSVLPHLKCLRIHLHTFNEIFMGTKPFAVK